LKPLLRKAMASMDPNKMLSVYLRFLRHSLFFDPKLVQWNERVASRPASNIAVVLLVPTPSFPTTTRWFQAGLVCLLIAMHPRIVFQQTLNIRHGRFHLGSKNVGVDTIVTIAATANIFYQSEQQITASRSDPKVFMLQSSRSRMRLQELF
jgi:hypothetical protein